jgi:hypothetical protein
MKRRRTILVPIAVLLVLTAAGCGGSVGTTTSATSATSSSTSSATGTSTSATTTPHATVTADEYDVCSALIQSVYIGAIQPKQIVITPVHDDNHQLGQAVGVMQTWWPDLGDAVDDFKAKNRTSSVLERRFTISVPYTIASEQEIASIFSINATGWGKFYAKYPDARGFLALSRVGFNQAKDTAVLYTEYQKGLTDGEGNVVLMKKTDGRWTVELNGTFWVS